ncbi:MAG TPA: HIT family protein [Acidimicrobiales bacterium]|nr:HIT family protein [Acidimicrobiales bacterium]|tara:strand:- start:616 stop:1032 length:417 start_codon:yes stop_codon:yes gene_type:complete
MASIFTKIINEEIPGRIIWVDPICIAMVDIRPLNRGHVLVVPREEVDRWHELPPDSMTHLMNIAHKVANAQQIIFEPARVGLMIAGFEVPHTHIHCVPIEEMSHLDFSQAQMGDPEDLDNVADLLRKKLNEAEVTQTS